MADAATAVVEKPKAEKKPTAGDGHHQETKPTAKAKKYRFKLLRGQYVETTYETITDPETGDKKKVPKNKIYQAIPKKGVFPTIDTDVDLEPNNGEHQNMKKFERIHGSATQTVSDPTKRLEGETINAYHKRMEELQKAIRGQLDETIKGLDKMTQEQLVTLAQAEEIDISAAKTVGDVRNTIREALFS